MSLGKEPHTSHPTTFGESINLPGVINASCVSTVSYDSHGLPLRAIFTASPQSEVFVAGFYQGKVIPHVPRRIWKPSADSFLCNPDKASSAKISQGQSAPIIISLAAVMLQSELPFSQWGCDTEPNRPDCSSNFPHDAVGILIAFEDVQSRTHLVFLVASLASLLFPSQVLENSLLFEQEICAFSPEVGVLRIFHHCQFSFRKPTQLKDSKPLGASHIFLLSCFDRTSKRETEGGKLMFFSLCWYTIPQKEPPYCGFVPVYPSSEGRYGDAQHKGSTLWVGACPQNECAEWICKFKPRSVISALEVFEWEKHGSTSPSIRAAAGGTDGRVYVLRENGFSLVRRMSGPVPDLKFVIPYASSLPTQEPSFRLRAVNSFLSQNCTRKDAEGSTTDSKVKQMTWEEKDISLIILDAAGKIIVLRRLNSKPYVQIISDVANVISMQVESGNFKYLTLVEMEKRKVVDEASSIEKAHSASEVESKSCIAGYALSSGLIYAAVRYSPHLQLLVSTLNEGLLTLVFQPSTDEFVVSCYTLFPTQVRYIGLLDFYSSGTDDLIIAGSENVLLARQPHSAVLYSNAELLVELLQSELKEAK